MRRIGIIGGMSAESTALYYKALNRGINARLGRHHSADCLIHSVDFEAIRALQLKGDWSGAGDVLARSARILEAGGAEAILIATNTMHLVAEQVQAAISVPLIHIADAVAAEITSRGLRRPGLLGTKFTMEQPFYRARLRERHGMDVIVPEAADRTEIDRVIFDELCKGLFEDCSRERYVRICGELAARGADCLILGCTEIGLLISDAHVSLPTICSAQAHVDAAIAFMLDTPVQAEAMPV